MVWINVQWRVVTFLSYAIFSIFLYLKKGKQVKWVHSSATYEDNITEVCLFYVCEVDYQVCQSKPRNICQTNFKLLLDSKSYLTRINRGFDDLSMFSDNLKYKNPEQWRLLNLYFVFLCMGEAGIGTIFSPQLLLDSAYCKGLKRCLWRHLRWVIRRRCGSRRNITGRIYWSYFAEISALLKTVLATSAI